MKYEVQTGDFQGPLDLLYQLVKKNKIEISEISLANITEQYIEHIKHLHSFNLELASEFLLIASELLEIKASLLLPKNREPEEDKEVELVQRLEEYKLFKNICQKMQERAEKASNCYRLPPEKELISGDEKLKIDISVEDLRNIYFKAVESREKDKVEDPHYTEMENINPDRLNVEDRAVEINKIITKKPDGVDFTDLIFNQKDPLEIVVTLLSLLELMKLRKIEVVQDSLFAEIKIMEKRQVV